MEDRRFSKMSDPIVVERYYDRQLTGRGQVASYLRGALRTLLKVVGFGLLLSIPNFLGVLTVDIPLRFLDATGIPLSSSLSRGEGVLALVLLGGLILTRRSGAVFASRALLLSWIFAFAFALMVIMPMAETLVPGDFPPWRFITWLILSFISGQMAAVWLYQLTRGGVWWRAPLIGGFGGIIVQVVIYQIGAYAGTDTPWLLWLAMHLLAGAALAALFLPIYLLLRPLVTPRSGFGGR